MKKESWFYKLRKHILVILLLAAAGRGTLCGQENAQTPAAPAQQAPAPRQTPATPTQQAPAPRQAPATPTQQAPAPRQTPAAPAQGPQQDQLTQTETAAKAKPELARLVVDVNPFMWIFSGILDKNNNRSIFFDVGIQYNMLPAVALRFNPSFSFGFTSETAFSDPQAEFLEVDLPLSLFCFPFPHDTYLDMFFFGVSVVFAYYNTTDVDADTVFASVGALLEVGYQLRLSNHLSVTPSIGVSRIFPKLINGDKYSTPNFNLYSPWTSDTPVAPRVRITVGFWV